MIFQYAVIMCLSEVEKLQVRKSVSSCKQMLVKRMATTDNPTKIFKIKTCLFNTLRKKTNWAICFGREHKNIFLVYEFSSQKCKCWLHMLWKSKPFLSHRISLVVINEPTYGILLSFGNHEKTLIKLRAKLLQNLRSGWNLLRRAADTYQ